MRAPQVPFDRPACRRRLMGPACVLGVALVLQGCASMDRAYRKQLDRQNREAAQHRATLDQNLRAWVGHPASDLVAQWTPTQSVSLPNDAMVLEYDYVENDLLGPTEQSKLRLQRAQQNGQNWCTERFVVGATGRVKSYNWRENGLGCPIPSRSGADR